MIIDFNITNYCNAKCPTCKRFDQDKYLELTNGLKLTHMDFEEFKRIVERDKEIYKNYICYFCGEFGDPLMHPKIKEFAEIANNSFKQLTIYSNGGVKRDEFFKYVAETNNSITIRFGIDGLTHEINNKYRINVNTELAFKNMFSMAKHRKAIWDYTIFEHNKHEIEDVIKLAAQHNLLLNLRCNLRPSRFGVNRITKSDYDEFVNISKKYKNTPYRIIFDTFWVN